MELNIVRLVPVNCTDQTTAPMIRPIENVTSQWLISITLISILTLSPYNSSVSPLQHLTRGNLPSYSES